MNRRLEGDLGGIKQRFHLAWLGDIGLNNNRSCGVIDDDPRTEFSEVDRYSSPNSTRGAGDYGDSAGEGKRQLRN
ncbi:unnamed protein product [Microthlaspi erraticum]|uniref:Uncharacterized protein n=1 Tax=Microthlaspi erraticum TaxID=1685480 RepID=A0A6D2JV45_9BRAS|nr:unnamed protein product [Microthlaspi erraticum]